MRILIRRDQSRLAAEKALIQIRTKDRGAEADLYQSQPCIA